MPKPGQNLKQHMQSRMHAFKAGKMHSGTKKGPVVKSREQAVAIGLSEAREAGLKGAKKPKR
jgi:hypothetical protein